PYIYLELILGPNEPIPVQKYLEFADINVFPYSFMIGNAFHQKNLKSLQKLNEQLPPSEKSIVFLENHDLERMDKFKNQLILSLHDQKLHQLGSVFMLTWPYGYPQVYSGFQFPNYDAGSGTQTVLNSNGECLEPWSCQHRALGIAALAQFRNHTNSFFNISNWWNYGKDQIAFSRGKLGFVVINLSAHSLNHVIPTDLRDGTYCNILSKNYDDQSKSCPSGINVKMNKISIELEPYSALVLQSNIKIDSQKDAVKKVLK
ncbi:MAG TPA: alpha amylase C-terminal domain-containing protein, partial [Pseudobdellovibrionaceae bacterium]|nr:alpha amylase C-terminal domain-containing protein [Pseudobdellovibrionaceae bacterium]